MYRDMTLYTILKSKIFTIGIVLIAGWLVLSVIRVQSHYASLTEKDMILSGKVAHMEQQNESLSAEISYGQHPVYLEKEARVKLNMKHPDEEVLFVYGEDEVVATVSEDVKASSIGELSNYKKWLKYLFGN